MTSATAPLLLFLAACGLGPQSNAIAEPAVELSLETGHPWRHPFGLDRVGLPLRARLSARSIDAEGKWSIQAYREGRQLGSTEGQLRVSAPLVWTIPNGRPDRLVAGLVGMPGTTVRVEVRRKIIEAEATAEPETLVNPVDLGAILVPGGTLLVGPGQTTRVRVALMGDIGSPRQVEVEASFASDPARSSTARVDLPEGKPVRGELTIPEPTQGPAKDVLRVILRGVRPKAESPTTELWRKEFPVMRVGSPPSRPAFGATSEQLRYDAPISVRDPKTGTFSTIPYETAWPAERRDVVVSFPNGARFVFWRGSSYIPFWAGRHNTGACYEWAEMMSRPASAVDCVEPLMDKELRFGRVSIVESTSARVIVRWRYQSTDLNYQVWGDEVVEDYVFYPDGFGTRVLTLRSDPSTEYELSEFIILTPAETYPFSVLPERLVDALYLDGRTHHFMAPAPPGAVKPPADPGVPAVYRLRLHRDEKPSAVYFSPDETRVPPVVFGSFTDGGEVVTPCYWGSHWPLARGNATGNTIDDRVHVTPCHNSVMSWASFKPTPSNTAEAVGLDAQGRARRMLQRRWVWLIGMTDEADRELLDRARSFSTPPSLVVRGGRLAFESYVSERRAFRIEAESATIEIDVGPTVPCVNPVFEFDSAPRNIPKVTLDGIPLDPGRFAWDGRTLWLGVTISKASRIKLDFPTESKPQSRGVR